MKNRPTPPSPEELAEQVKQFDEVIQPKLYVIWNADLKSDQELVKEFDNGIKILRTKGES